MKAVHFCSTVGSTEMRGQGGRGQRGWRGRGGKKRSGGQGRGRGCERGEVGTMTTMAHIQCATSTSS